MSTSHLSDAPQPLLAGRYRVERELGKGGMAGVFEVVDTASGAHLALKCLFAGAGDTHARAFEREYRLLAGLRHPCIVRAYDFGSHGGQPFYTMELLEGEELATRVPMPWREVCACLRDAASTLGVLHGRRKVHRDLSARNLWRTSTGRIKLLDFGSVTDFGRTENVIGTPPYVPPEALDDRELDPRSDLYSLGALGYWLLTSEHAYPAGRITDLQVLWKEAPSPPSSLVRLFDEASEPVPAALDELILSLLSLDPAERPPSTEDVIDRLNEIAGLEPEVHDVVVRGALASQAFVGRSAERTVVERRLRRAHAGRPSAVWIQGESGMGRSRMLTELSTLARIRGATPLSVGREAGRRPYAAAAALALELLAVLPEQARAAAAPHAGALTELSPALGEALGATSASPAGGEAMDLRARKQAALAALFRSVSKERTLVVLVDDVELLDEESQAWLAGLVRAAEGHRLCVIVTANTETEANETHTLEALRSAARVVPLARLKEADTEELLRSMWGEVPFLTRLAAHLHALSEGNPGRCMLLIEHLVHRGVVQYTDGAWTLPQELPETDLPATLRDGLLASVERLPNQLRTLARCLSVPDSGALTFEMAQAASGLTKADTTAALEGLESQGVLADSPEGFVFQHEVQRRALYEGLSVSERRQVHSALATVLEGDADSDPLYALRAGLHWLRAGNLERAEPRIFEAGQAYMQGSVAESLRRAAPMFADAVELLRGHGRDDHALWLPLAVLAYAGYFVDRRYGFRYGAQAIDVLSGAVRLPLARRLRPFIGRKLSMIVALIVAAITLRKKPFTPRVPHLIYCLVSAATTTAAVHAVTLHPTAVRTSSAVLRELSVLRSAHVVRFLLLFTDAMALISESRVGEAQAKLREVIGRLEHPDGVPGLPENARVHYLAHSYAVHGLYDAWSCDDACLHAADRAESFGPFHAMWAHQVRAIYYSQHGDTELGNEFAAQVELLAIQLGSVWQVEAWSPVVRFMSLTRDAVATKRASEQMLADADQLPHYAVLSRWMRGAYLTLRGNYAAALACLEPRADEPPLLTTWPVARGWLAECLNGMGEHARAKEVCEQALGQLGVNRGVLYFSVRLEIELARAQAGLGMAEEACARMDRLIARHEATAGAIVGGTLQLVRGQLALAEGDHAGCKTHLERASKALLDLEMAGLTKELANLRNGLSEARGERSPQRAEGERQNLTRARRMLKAATTVSECEPHAVGALRTALELSHADRGFVLLASGEVGPSTGAPPTEELLEWARMEQHVASLDPDTDDLDQETVSSGDSSQLTWSEGEASYRIVHLWRPGAADVSPVASLVLGLEGAEPAAPGPEVAGLLAQYLSQSNGNGPGPSNAKSA